MPWYKFTPPALETPDVCNPFHYTLVGLTPPPCMGNKNLCAIQTSDNMTRPFITPLLICEIANAVNNRTNSINALLDL